MTKIPESTVKRRIKQILDAHGKRVWHFAPVSNGMGKHGVPDRIACVNGRFVGIEAKGSGGRLSAHQHRELSLISSANGIAVLTEPGTEDHLEWLIRKLVDEPFWNHIPDELLDV